MGEAEFTEEMLRIGTALRDSGKNPEEVEEMLLDQSYRVADELREQENA